jgi:hypothetical protein
MDFFINSPSSPSPVDEEESSPDPRLDTNPGTSAEIRRQQSIVAMRRDLNATGKCETRCATYVFCSTHFYYSQRTSKTVGLSKVLDYIADHGPAPGLDTSEMTHPWPEFEPLDLEPSFALSELFVATIKDFGARMEYMVSFAPDTELARLTAALYDAPVPRSKFPIRRPRTTDFAAFLASGYALDQFSNRLIAEFSGRPDVSNFTKHTRRVVSQSQHMEEHVGKTHCTLRGMRALIASYRRSTQTDIANLHSIDLFRPPDDAVASPDLLATANLVRRIVTLVRKTNRVCGVNKITSTRWDFMLPVHQYFDHPRSYVP